MIKKLDIKTLKIIQKLEMRAMLVYVCIYIYFKVMQIFLNIGWVNLTTTFSLERIFLFTQAWRFMC